MDLLRLGLLLLALFLLLRLLLGGLRLLLLLLVLLLLLGLLLRTSTEAAWSWRILWLFEVSGGDADRLEEIE